METQTFQHGETDSTGAELLEKGLRDRGAPIHNLRDAQGVPFIIIPTEAWQFTPLNHGFDMNGSKPHLCTRRAINAQKRNSGEQERNNCWLTAPSVPTPPMEYDTDST
ncbi:hypothetical protein J7T55_013118 [Diaporthe amygdali]|uniref:uncharacterized protein n=1 Tax=Phomopsis amygdali TaxID=1214568 RepID=UPI0022FED131|nr:uncharacterized protein J7T55_013118 [Diaporthe amygdali]KAJ0118862.1 hypothetical protein J7T55_013118 [Diaporthe amygdali]